MIRSPTFETSAGPTIWIDEAHNNVVATAGRYTPLMAVLGLDGYVVRPLRAKFTAIALEGVKVLVIGNPLHERNVRNWSLPAPSAFEPPEIDAVRDWIGQGGSLLLLLDHMPFPAAAGQLAAAFGLDVLNGYVEDPNTWDPIVFRRTDGTLRDHFITSGSRLSDRIAVAATFDGSAFKAPGTAVPLLVLGPRHVSYHPIKSWDIDSTTPTVSVDGWLQGAALEFGGGRVAVFADATMFSAQLGPEAGAKLGMNTDVGAENLQLLRNTMRWLTRSGDALEPPSKQLQPAAGREES